MREQLQNAASLENDEENEQSLTVVVEDFPIEEENDKADDVSQAGEVEMQSQIDTNMDYYYLLFTFLSPPYKHDQSHSHPSIHRSIHHKSKTVLVESSNQ